MKASVRVDNSHCLVSRAARLSGWSEPQIRRLVDSGRLSAVTVDGVRLIEISDLQRLIAERAAAAERPYRSPSERASDPKSGGGADGNGTRPA